MHSNSCGPVEEIPLETGKSITGKFYKDVVLQKVKKFYKKKRLIMISLKTT